MEYRSTRGPALRADSKAAVLRGLAPDGGLYVTDEFGGFDWRGVLPLDTLAMAERILGFLLPDFSDMGTLVRRAYAGKFETEDLTPLVQVGDRYVLELFHGPTAAFKDIALSVLPRLITAARGTEAEKTLVLTATSGDTGKAALAGFCDVERTEIAVFYPDGGVSPIQKAQMVTQEGRNVHVCAVRGNFDDTQTAVKAVFAEGLDPGLGVHLSSANSINIGRLAPQVVYYFKAYAELVRQNAVRVGEPVDFVVPTGNFGDILAGYFAKRMGLPVGTLVCASNRNNVLTDFLQTGVYDCRRPFYRTLSPSMDILISSNLERLLWLLEPEQVAERMRQLRERGWYAISGALLARLRAEFSCGCCDDAQTLAAIGAVWREHGYLADTHTAVAWHVAQAYRTDRPVVVLSTASPYKFPAAVLTALCGETPDDEFAALDRLHALTGVPVPPSLAALRGKPVLHREVIEPAQMREYLCREIGQWEK